MNDTIRKPPPWTCSEAEFQRWVIDTAKRRDWDYSHTYRAKMEDGQWRTTCAKGWPDLVLVRGPRIVFMELKSVSGTTDPDQEKWLDRLALVTCAEVWVLDPTMADEVISILW